jgi:hypothetical protein
MRESKKLKKSGPELIWGEMSIDHYISGFFTGYDPTYEPIFHAAWADWEEDGWVWIFVKNGQYYGIEGGYCLGAGGDGRSDWQYLESLTHDEALNLMMEWEEHEEEFDEFSVGDWRYEK